MSTNDQNTYPLYKNLKTKLLIKLVTKEKYTGNKQIHAIIIIEISYHSRV